MATHKMIANKAMTYRTRRLQADEPFEARTRRDFAALKITNKARADDGSAQDPPDEPAVADIAALRAEYQARFDKRPFMGWSADQLREKLAES